MDSEDNNMRDCYIFNDKLMKVWKADLELKEPLYFASVNALTLKGEVYYYGIDKNRSGRFINLEFSI
ncbi:hypothetical protein SteCoe_33924 [Stentor coeruleus]|uniref:Uncharacterized protein n=1 Tax=Stentor coeruleus TaxID=5963 RepID=A0A1R2AW00_9CILI|nr:hypothetical protein SteCoe_33924 [Stentor coeruleus]